MYISHAPMAQDEEYKYIGTVKESPGKTGWFGSVR